VTRTKPILLRESAIQRILVWTDFSEGMEAVACALTIAQKDRSHVTLLHVVPDLELELSASCRNSLTNIIRKELEDLVPPNARAQVFTRVEFGLPYRTIIRTLEQMKPDLFIMNAAQTGSVADRLVHVASCPVILAPPMELVGTLRANTGGNAA
jgi:nucleotide-binding universal stress UspA family protein